MNHTTEGYVMGEDPRSPQPTIHEDGGGPMTACDAHPDRAAVARMRGETDSFGSEVIHCCSECRDEIRAINRSGTAGRCDWCRQEAADLKERRDSEEGSSGRVYHVCGGCRRRSDERLECELQSYGG